MSRNVGDGDRVARLMSGATLSVIFFRHRANDVTKLVLGLISVWLLATAVAGWCPFYAIFRFSTCRLDDAQAVKK